MSNQANKRVRISVGIERSRQPLPAHAWPGGYPIYYVFTDGGCICPNCVNQNIVLIDEAIRSKEGNKPHSSGCGGWAIDSHDINYDDDNLFCDNCGNKIESAYSDK